MTAYKAELSNVTLDLFENWFAHDWVFIWRKGICLSEGRCLPLTNLDTMDHEGMAQTVTPEDHADVNTDSFVFLAREETQNPYYSRWSISGFGPEIESTLQCVLAVTQHHTNAVSIWLLDLSDGDRVSDPLRFWIATSFNAEITSIERQQLGHYAKADTDEKIPKEGVCERVLEFHRLVRDYEYSYTLAYERSRCAPATYKKWCRYCTKEDPVLPYR